MMTNDLTVIISQIRCRLLGNAKVTLHGTLKNHFRLEENGACEEAACGKHYFIKDYICMA
mgnify:CR=1 FL=1